MFMYSSIIQHLGASKVVLVVKNSFANAGDIRDLGSIPGWGRSLGGGPGSQLQYSYLESTVDKGAWQATVHGVTEKWTRLKWLSMHAHIAQGTSFSTL